jgi:hypothetical protein
MLCNATTDEQKKQQNTVESHIDCPPFMRRAHMARPPAPTRVSQ